MKHSIRTVGRSFRAACSIGLAAAMLAAPAFAQNAAQNFPSKPVTVIWPYPPGGSASEVKMRAMYNEAGRMLGQPFVWDYKPGAGARQGVVTVAKAAPDGHTLAFATDTLLTVLAQTSSSFNAQVERDYTPVFMPYGISLVVTAHPKLPFKDFKGWVAYAKANPGKLSFGSSGVGGTAHLAMQRVADALGIDMLHVPYVSQPFMTDLLNGTFDIMTFSTTALAGHINAGKLVGLVQASSKRVAALPNLPTLKESGVDLAIDTWNAIVTAPGTPPEIVAKLNTTLAAAQKAPEVAKMFIQDESLMFTQSPKEITELIKADTARVKPIIQRMNLKFD